MKLKTVDPLSPNEYYVLDGGFSTQLSRFEEREESSVMTRTVFLISDMSTMWTLTPCGQPGAW